MAMSFLTKTLGASLLLAAASVSALDGKYESKPVPAQEAGTCSYVDPKNGELVAYPVTTEQYVAAEQLAKLDLENPLEKGAIQIIDPKGFVITTADPNNVPLTEITPADLDQTR